MAKIGRLTGASDAAGPVRVLEQRGGVDLELSGAHADLFVGGDLRTAAGQLPGDGTVQGGVIRQAHSIQMPWAYTQTAESISDPALGTAIHVPMDVIVDNDPPGLLGPQFQSGHFGPRGIV
ncbi:MAG: hypothetical protein L0Y54_23070, partial [Sporichthyaceae bacterium]|nr:hypothetical protein [Sporichthyaceae bacterium]